MHGYGGFYLTIVKKNQPTLYDDLQDFFDDPEAEQDEWQYAKRVQKGHGRLETRELWASTQMNEWFERDWTGIAQIFRIQRWVKDAEHEREEVVYGITNLPRRKANASRLLALQQEHWHIENRLHWRRDVMLGEDACQTHTGPNLSLLAQLNSTVLSLMDRLGVRNVARQMRYFDAHLEQALDLLLTSHCCVY